MYDTFYKSFTDYNNDEANTDKFITKFEVTLSDLSLLDTLYWQYVDESTIPTTTTTTTTTTLPKAEDVVEDNVTTYLAWDKNGCEHPDNPLSFTKGVCLKLNKIIGSLPCSLKCTLKRFCASSC